MRRAALSVAFLMVGRHVRLEVRPVHRMVALLLGWTILEPVAIVGRLLMMSIKGRTILPVPIARSF